MQPASKLTKWGMRGRQVPLSALKWQQRHLANSCPGVTLLDHSSDPELQVRLGTARVRHALLHALRKCCATVAKGVGYQRVLC